MIIGNNDIGTYKRAMVILCHAVNDMEVMYIRALLQNAEIPFHIVGEHFGSLYPGMQIAFYNERRFLVPKVHYQAAEDLIRNLRDTNTDHQEQIDSDLTLGAKIRIILETFLFGWSSIGGKKKSVTNFRIKRKS